MHLHWFLPAAGDSRDIVGPGHRLVASDTATIARPPDIDYLAAVARAAEHFGFEALLTPTAPFAEDPWLITAALTRETRRLKFIVAVRPGTLSPTLAAQMSATYQRLSGGRLMLNVVSGGDADEQRRFGDWLSPDDRHRRTAEFIAILRGAWAGTPYSYVGTHYQVHDATVSSPPVPVPPVFFGGASNAAVRVAAEHVDTYLAAGEPPPALAARIAGVRAAAARRGRELTYGLRLQVIARPTSADAWTVAESLLDRLYPAAIDMAQAQFASSEPDGQRRMPALPDSDTGTPTKYPNLWAGFGRFREDAGTTLVGSYTGVADRLSEFHALGVDHFILSGQPNLDEAYWFGEGVLPILRDRGLLDGGGNDGGSASRRQPESIGAAA